MQELCHAANASQFVPGGYSECMVRRPATATINAKYGRDPTVTFYTHVSDQYGPFHTKVINSTVRDALYVLDGLLGRDTDLRIKEHYTDTAGFTDQVFGTCHMLGFRFAPRIRDLGDHKIHPMARPGKYPSPQSLIGGAVNVKRIEQYWDDLLRLICSIGLGTVAAHENARQSGPTNVGRGDERR